MKATVVLLPLLSITSILFIWAPDVQKSPTANLAYRITNACLQVAQVSLCRMNCFSRKSSRLEKNKKIETGSASGVNNIFKHMPGFACFTLFYHHLTKLYIVFPSCCEIGRASCRERV